MVPFDLTGRTAVATGGSWGIGRAIALGLPDAGAGVAPVARSREDVAATAGAARERGAGACVGTDLTESLRADDDLAASIRERTPLDRFAESEGIAGAAVSLASDAASYVTGAVVTAGDGWTAR